VAHAKARNLGLIGVVAKVWEVTDGRERLERFYAKNPREVKLKEKW